MPDIAVAVHHLCKGYYLYRRPIHRVIETLLPLKKPLHTSFEALAPLSFTVQRGESIGIIGRNGSGKSTLLQLICGNLQPTGGSVHVKGRISALLELGAGFNPEFTGRENVYLNTAILGLSKEETDARFDQIASFSEIGDFIDRPVKMYSSGMYVRLAFATAVSIDPDILIVDEALAVGDIFFQQKCVHHMKQMMERCTILVVSHDMHAVSTLCDRVLVLDQGNLLFDGTPMEAVALYTKLVHTERYTSTRNDVAHREIHGEAKALSAPLNGFKGIEVGDEPWITVPEEKRGGAGEVTIFNVSVTKEGLPLTTVQEGETVTVKMVVHARRDVAESIFGYTVKDRVGVALFGENSLCLDNVDRFLPEGLSLVTFSFVWPEVYPEQYTLTLGVGEGTHPLVHVIQCWAHNIISFAAVVPHRSVHGIFNNPLQQLTIARAARE